MAVSDEIKWFKDTFFSPVNAVIAGTPISLDLVSAIAYQESGELWSRMRSKLPVNEVLRLCCGDTLDSPNRSAFPRKKADLVAVPKGQEMFDLAHSLLGEMAAATGIEAYQRLAQRPDKFVHGYGMFQYDLQFFKEDPDFFLQQQWKTLGGTLGKLMKELKSAIQRLGYDAKTSLTDRESAFAAIVYNTGFGNFKEGKELRQGYFDGAHFYGENIDAFLKIARTIPGHSAVLGGGMVNLGGTARRTVMEIAKNEYDTYHGIDEGKQPLRGHIADYYEAGNGSRDLDPTKSENAWSAAFVSYCIRKSGATKDQFAFALKHSVFVYAAIRNTDAGRGVFRGHPVTEYAPKLGDIIHHNRSGNSFGFDYARAHSDYLSHSAIVVDFVVENAVRYAVTIGGNEALAGGTGTVGTKRFALDANGLLDQAKIKEKLISVIENRLEEVGTAGAVGRYVVRVRTDLKLRGGPGTSFDVIKPLFDGTQLNVVAFEDNASGRWAAVDLEGDGVKDGYVFAAFIEPVVG